MLISNSLLISSANHATRELDDPPKTISSTCTCIIRISLPCCRMDLPRPTTSVGTRTDYSVGPWDYSTCAARHMMAWSTRTTEEKYSDRKLYKSRTV
jgi:hypothetical protein